MACRAAAASGVGNANIGVLDAGLALVRQRGGQALSWARRAPDLLVARQTQQPAWAFTIV
jgi:hypothetical protein